MGSILDQDKIMFLAESPEGVKIAGLPGKMDWNNSFRLRRQDLYDAGWVELEGLAVNVGENRPCPDELHHVHGRWPR
jgi:hypothetical protein